jgi:hypothetical protein
MNLLTPSNSHLWKKIKSVDSFSSQKYVSIPKLLIYKQYISSAPEVAEAFAEGLGKVLTEENDSEFDEGFKRSIEHGLRQSERAPSVFNDPTDVLELESEIKNLRRKGSPDEDQIPNKVIKILPRSYLEILVKIYNAYLTLNYIPSSWKTAFVFMIPKPLKD